MKNAIFILMIISIFLSCEKDKKTSEINYDLKIIRVYENGDHQDSSVFYYNDDHQLLAYEKYTTASKTQKGSVNYANNRIVMHNTTYFLSTESRLDSVVKYISDTSLSGHVYSYSDNHLIAREKIHTSIPEKEYYIYEGTGHLKDSVVYRFDPAVGYVMHYTYTDTLKPFFMVDACGLFEFPAKSDYLIRQEETFGFSGTEMETIGSLAEYSYKFLENSIEIERVSSANADISAEITTYKLIAND